MEEQKMRDEETLPMCYPHKDGYGDVLKKLAGDEMAAFFVQFLDEMPGGFLIYQADRNEEILYANEGLLRIFQCGTMEEFCALTGNSFRGLVHPEDLEAVEESIWSQVTESQHDLDYVEYRVRRRDGAVRWIEDYGHFVHSETAGDIFYVFLSDATEKRERLITEKKLLLNEKLEKEQKLQTLIEEYDKERSLINQEYLRQLEVIEGLSVNYESICYVDLETDTILPYRLSVRTAALLSGELRGKRSYSRFAKDYVEMWVHPEDRELVAESTDPARIREKLADSRTYYLNFRVVVEGEVQYIQLRLVNVGHGDAVSQVVLGYRRVDDEIRQQMEQQTLLAEALAKANLAITSKNTFLSNMSHDMRTPLHAIFGFTSLAKLNVDDPAEALDYLDRVETASRQLLDMIDKVLEVSSLAEESGLDEAECDLREAVQSVFEFLKPQAQEKSIDFALDCGGVRHNIVHADREKLRQLTLYLANNAVTYTQSGGRVAISLREVEELPNDYSVFHLSVEDTGIGISPGFLEKVFEPFSREKNSTLSGVHGIGLGLTIAKNIVDMMGGSLEVKSEVDKGSTFTACLTFRVQPKPAGVQRDNGPDQSVQRILLAEDNEINREIETELLERLGFAVESAENGKACLELLERSAPGWYELVLLDLQMPVMDGWRAAEAIRALPDPTKARIPIIALSANVLESAQLRSKECGINVHLLKPMDLALLLSTIEQLTGRNRPTPQNRTDA